MTPRTETFPTMSRARLLARTTARAGAVLSASMLLLGLSAIGSSDASAAPLAPGASSAGPVVMNPPTGNGDTDFGLSFPTSQVCPGNGSADGYRWHTFITPTGTDIASFTWSPAGSPQNAPGFTRNLFNAGGSGVRNQFPADSPAGAVTNIPADLEFSGGGVFGPAPAVPIPAGTYTLRIAAQPDTGDHRDTAPHSDFVLLSPVATVWALRHHGGSGMGATSFRLPPSGLRSLPLPAEGAMWDEAAEAARSATLAAGADARGTHLMESARLTCQAFGVPDEPVTAWWAARSPFSR